MDILPEGNIDTFMSERVKKNLLELLLSLKSFLTYPLALITTAPTCPVSPRCGFLERIASF
jgi:hypothetical protein